MYGLQVAYNTIYLLLWDLSKAIIEEYHDEVIVCPTSPQEWKRIVDQFSLT